jgi:hypothetical protein
VCSNFNLQPHQSALIDARITVAAFAADGFVGGVSLLRNMPGKGSGQKSICPAGVMDRMTDFESVGRGSIPRLGAEFPDPEVFRIARDSPKVKDGVRFS